MRQAIERYAHAMRVALGVSRLHLLVANAVLGLQLLLALDAGTSLDIVGHKWLSKAASFGTSCHIDDLISQCRAPIVRLPPLSVIAGGVAAAVGDGLTTSENHHAVFDRVGKVVLPLLGLSVAPSRQRHVLFAQRGDIVNNSMQHLKQLLEQETLVKLKQLPRTLWALVGTVVAMCGVFDRSSIRLAQCLVVAMLFGTDIADPTRAQRELFDRLGGWSVGQVVDTIVRVAAVRLSCRCSAEVVGVGVGVGAARG